MFDQPLGPRRRSSGFGVTELLISSVIAAIVLLSGFKLANSYMQKGTRSVRNEKLRVETSKFLEKLNFEVANIVTLRPFGTTFATAGTALGNYTKDSRFVPAALVAFPGFTLADLNARTDLAPIDPSAVDLTDRWYDAFRIAYLVQNSQAIFLAKQPPPPIVGIPPDTAAYPTSQNTSATANRPIILASPPDSKVLQVGDFAVISDNRTADLFRVTNIQGANVYHSATTSIWNAPLPRDYGELQAGNAYIQRVAVATYAYDPTMRILYRDDHRSDDGFDALNNTFGTKGLAKNWVPVLTDVANFQVSYVLKEEYTPSCPDGAPGTAGTRCPSAEPIGTWSDPSTGRGNELGHPILERVKVRLQQTVRDVIGNTKAGALREVKTETTSRDMNPENLRRGLSLMGTAENLSGPAIYLTRPPTPPPTETPPSGGGGGGGGGPDPGTPGGFDGGADGGSGGL